MKQQLQLKGVIMLIASLLQFSLFSNAQTPIEDKWSTAFFENSGFAGEDIHSIQFFNDELYICGNWGSINGDEKLNYLAKWNGSDWEAIGSDLNGEVYDMIITEDSIIACGAFTQAGGDPAADYLAVYSFETQTWKALIDAYNDGYSDIYAPVYSMILNEDKLYIGGAFDGVGEIGETSYIAVWDFTGQSWSGLSSGEEPDGLVSSMALLNDKIYVGGSFSYIGTLSTGGFASYDLTDNSWASYGAVNGIVNVVKSYGTNIYLGGDFEDISEEEYTLLVSFDPLSQTFANLGMSGDIVNDDSGVADIAFYDDHIYAAGGCYFNGNIAFGIFDGESWSGIGSSIFDDEGSYGYAIALDETGNIYVASDLSSGETNGFNYFGKFDGANWTSIINTNGKGLSSDVEAIVKYDGDYYVGGNFSHIGGDSDMAYIARYDGSQWYIIGGTPLNGKVEGIIFINDVMYIHGDFTNAGGDAFADGLAYWNGNDWSAVGGIQNSTINDFATDGTKLYIAGNFLDWAGIAEADNVAVWDGVNWSALNDQPISVTLMESIAVDGSDIYLGGWFTDAAGNTGFNNIVKWNGVSYEAVGDLSAINHRVRDIAVKGDSVLIAGSFTNVAGNTDIDRVALWDGTSWTGPGVELAGTILTVCIDNDDLYFGGTSDDHIYLWNAEGTNAIGSGLDNEVYTLLVDESALWVGGNFKSNNNGVPMSSISTYNLADITISGDYDLTSTYGEESDKHTISISATRFYKDLEVFVNEGLELYYDGEYVSFNKYFYPVNSTITETVKVSAADYSHAGSFTSVLSIRSDEEDYSIDLNVTVNKADLFITAEDKQMNQGETVPELTMTYEGFVDGEDESVIDVLPSIATTATSLSAAGTYPITLLGGNDNNYNLQLTGGSLEVLLATSMSTGTVGNISIYPNPANDYLVVNTDQTAQVSIYGLTGQLQQSGYTNQSLDISNLSKGIYLVQIKGIQQIFKITKR